MSVPEFDAARDLQISRVIQAPREDVWRAWADRASLERWWVPAPAKCKVQQMDLRPGGAFVTSISEQGGDFVPHFSGCFLAVEEQRLIVFSDALRGGWRPAEQPFMTAIVTLEDHARGTRYAGHVMHSTQGDRNRHEKLGFFDGWGTVLEQLAAQLERSP